MSRIYLAGPFFSEEQIERISRIEKALTENDNSQQAFILQDSIKRQMMTCSALAGRKKFMNWT
jgi:nucleoside 2-deoxyribosyltransferase